MTGVRLILATLLLTLTGCQTQLFARRPKPVTPVLSSEITCEVLVDHLNQQTAGLVSWRSSETRVHVRMPGLPMPQRLSGTLACTAPSNFRLIAGNMVAHADFGANDNLCWAYAKPGDPVVLTWAHEDSYLLSRLPGGIPHLDASWLLSILGVVPMNAEDYELIREPGNGTIASLVDVDDTADGGRVQHVVRVDLVTGMVREHTLTDEAGVVLVRAQMRDHRRVTGAVIPHEIQITFPATRTELTLNFARIETNCSVPETVWQPPGGRGIERVDLRTILEAVSPQSAYTQDAMVPISNRMNAEPFADYGRENSEQSDTDSEALSVPQFDEPPVRESRWRRLPFFRWFSR
jgi:hypothetical protein